MTIWNVARGIVGGAVGGALLRLILIGIVRLSGVGMLDRLLGDLWSYPFFFWCVVGAAVGLILENRYVKLQFLDWAGQHGFDFHEQVSRESLGYGLSLAAFDEWYEARNYLIGRLDGTSVEMVDFTKEHKGGGEFRNHPVQTVIVLPAIEPNLPDFEICPRDASFVVLDATGLTGMQIIAGSDLGSLNADVVNRFNQWYALYPSGQRETVEPAPNSQQVPLAHIDRLRSLFTLDLIRFFVDHHPRWHVESCNGHLAFWKPNKVVPISRRQSMLEEIKEIRTALFRADENPQNPKLDIQFVSPDRSIITKRTICFAVCIFGGFFLGLYGGGAFGPFLLHRSLLTDVLTLFGSLIAGTLAGGFVGLILAKKF